MPPHHPEPAPKQYEPFNVTNHPAPEPSAPSTLSKLSALQMPLRPFLATLVILLAISLGVGYVVVFRTDLVNAWAGFEETPAWPTAPVTTYRSTAVASDPTANWQTYRNDEYGFEFKYPEDLTGQVEGKDGMTLVGPCLAAGVFDTQQNFDTNRYTDNDASGIFRFCIVDTSENGLTPEPDSLYGKVLPLLKKGHFFIFDSSVPSKEYTDQILSTFRFTN